MVNKTNKVSAIIELLDMDGLERVFFSKTEVTMCYSSITYLHSSSPTLQLGEYFNIFQIPIVHYKNKNKVLS